MLVRLFDLTLQIDGEAGQFVKRQDAEYFLQRLLPAERVLAKVNDANQLAPGAAEFSPSARLRR